MAQVIGSRGLANADLVIPQGASFDFTVTHKDEQGNAVDHTASTIKMALQGRGGTHQMDEYCTGTSTGVTVAIPASVTAALPVGTLNWDMAAEMSNGEVVFLLWGKAQVVDTYSLDSQDE